MKKIICFSLWGEDEKYTVGAIKNAELAKTVYPDWVCRYYVGKSVPLDITNDLIKRDNTEVFVMNTAGDWTSMFWRFLPASDTDVDYMLSRDADSRLNKREKAAVDAWVSSGLGFHIMRDHPLHATEILGGMWGAKGGAVPNMRRMISDYVKGNFWQVDQNFLKEKIYPMVEKDSMVHDPFFQKINFPTRRTPGRFVGQAFNSDDTLFDPSHALMIKDIIV